MRASGLQGPRGGQPAQLCVRPVLVPRPLPCGRLHGPRSAGQLGLFCTQVIIVIYLSVVGALLLYMGFLMLVDPLIRKPDAYTERLHNEESEVRALLAPPPRSLPGPFTLLHAAFSLLQCFLGEGCPLPSRAQRAALSSADLASGSLGALAERGSELARMRSLRPGVQLTVGLEWAPRESAEPRAQRPGSSLWVWGQGTPGAGL